MRQNQRRQYRRLWRVSKLVLAMGTLVAAITLMIGVVAADNGFAPVYTPGKLGAGGGPNITGHKGFSHCGEVGQPACPPVPNTWVPLASESAADVLAALKSCPDYMSPVEAASADSAQVYAFDTPILVKPATKGSKAEIHNLPHFMIRASVQGVRYVTYDVVYDPVKHLMRISSVGIQAPKDAHYNKSFPWAGVSQDSAVQRLHTAKGLDLAVGKTPELVYFATNPPNSPAQASTWGGGGEDPAMPIWRLKGADNRTYFVGIDGQVYVPGQLPIEPGTTVIDA